MLGFVPISLCFAELKVCTGVGSSIPHKFTLNPKGCFKSEKKSDVLSTISGDTQAKTRPIQLLHLNFSIIFGTLSPEGNLQFFF